MMGKRVSASNVTGPLFLALLLAGTVAADPVVEGILSWLIRIGMRRP